MLAVWPFPSVILSSRIPCSDDVRVGVIKYFLLHSAKVKSKVNTDSEDIVEKTHIIACVDWNEDHSRKFFLGIGTCKAFTSASFMPVSQISTQCAIVDRKMRMNYGEDSIQISLHLKRHSILLNNTRAFLITNDECILVSTVVKPNVLHFSIIPFLYSYTPPGYNTSESVFHGVLQQDWFTALANITIPV